MKRDLSDDEVQPILVVLVWRGGARFQRALNSIEGAEKYFKRVVLSVTSNPDSEDMHIASRYLAACASRGKPSKAEIICSQTELPTMRHQAFWINYLQTTGAKESDWIYWLAYDDQLRRSGIERLVDSTGNWPLDPEVSYIGPWAVRHESANELWSAKAGDRLDSWTSFPIEGPTKLPVLEWIRRQFERPTYIQMSGSILPLRAHAELVQKRPVKRGPMRIEMATILETHSKWVAEFPSPITIIYGRPNSDRANYARTARREDADLSLRLISRMVRHPRQGLRLVASAFRAFRQVQPDAEFWDIRDWDIET